jgi:FkbM family methyltransferase
MMQLSYAQNLEDHTLNLIFPDLGDGTYVDVGGGHPVADNVTFYAYLKGWRGLVVEPQEDLARLYASIRPRDHVVSSLAGRLDGEIDFHIVDGLHGLSSANRENAESAAKYGAGFKTVKRQVRRLSRLIDDAGLTTIHVLKIDVEGAEPDVLAGLDFTRHQPRVILVEAVNPHTTGDEWMVWEQVLIAAGYTFAYFDNLNRYYVAPKYETLIGRFPKSPTPWDAVAHLWDCGRVAERSDHPDRALFDLIVKGLCAELPKLEPKLLARLIEQGLATEQSLATEKAPTTVASIQAIALSTRLIGQAELPRMPSTANGIQDLLATDEVRAAIGRIACMYDGGHLHD